MNRELRPHQTKAIKMLRQSLGSGKRRPVLQAPTGFGKKLLGAAIIEGALAKNKRVIFTVPALSLVDQTVNAFWDDGIRDVGVIQAWNPMTDWSRPVQVASVRTLQRRPIPEADIVIIDECHHWFDFYEAWMSDPLWQDRPFIGLSATPWTRGLGKYFDDLIIAATTQDLISEGYLSPFRVFAPSHPDLTDVRTVRGDYHKGDLSGVMSDAPLVADVVDTWRRRAENRSTFCFAVDRAHAKHLQAKFTEAGWQYWRLFHDAVSGPDAPRIRQRNPTARALAKLQLLKELKLAGIWLVDASIIALYPRVVSGNDYKNVLQACWEAHVANVIAGCSPSAVLIVGKGVNGAVGDLVKQAAPQAEVAVVNQPNARMTNDQTCKERLKVFDLCRRHRSN